MADDRHQEEVTVEMFEQIILEAGKQYFLNPVESQIPNWTRAITVIPHLREQLLNAAIADASEVRKRFFIGKFSVVNM